MFTPKIFNFSKNSPPEGFLPEGSIIFDFYVLLHVACADFLSVQDGLRQAVALIAELQGKEGYAVVHEAEEDAVALPEGER